MSTMWFTHRSGRSWSRHRLQLTGCCRSWVERSLAIGNVSWKSDAKVEANNSFEMAEKLSRYWKSSPGAVIVGENYSAALAAAPIASYLNWPILFVDEELPR